jgi:hypothetical protein
MDKENIFSKLSDSCSYRNIYDAWTLYKASKEDKINPPTFLRQGY